MPVSLDPDAPGAYIELHRSGAAVTVSPATLARMVTDADVRLASRAGIAAVLGEATAADIADALDAGPALFAVDGATALTAVQLAGALIYFAALTAVHDILEIEGIAVRPAHPSPVRASHLAS